MEERAGFWIRFGAMFLDGVIIGLPLSILLTILTAGQATETTVNFFFSLYIVITATAWKGFTVGKRICGIRIRKADYGDPPGFGSMLLREFIGGLFYALTFGIGVIVSIFMIVLREDRRAIHDFIAGTEVVYD